MVFAPDAPKATLSRHGDFRVIPTIPGSFEKLQESLSRIITNLEKVQFDQIGAELQQTLKETRNTVNGFGGLAGKLDKETAPQVQATLAELQKTLVELQQSVGKDSPLNYNARKTLEELNQTLRSFRELADTLELRPQSVIFGKETKKNE